MKTRALFIDTISAPPHLSIRTIDVSDLPPGDVLVRVLYSSLNYKDALALTGSGKIIRGALPFIPGIDLVGIVEQSDTDQWKKGDWVLATGWGIGEHSWGGYSGCQRLQSEWLTPLPESLAPIDSMALGTAGLTAMLAVMALETHGATPERGEVVVTGASGGVGTLAVTLLTHAGYSVAASTGTASAVPLLNELGVSRVFAREELSAGPARPLESARWAGAVDTVGGSTLATLISAMHRHASIAVCGNAGGAELTTTVYPFILRGINLFGIDSNTCPAAVRMEAWKRLADEFPKERLNRITRVISLDDLEETAHQMISGLTVGRIVVDVQA